MITPATALPSGGISEVKDAPISNTGAALASQEVFLQLLVAQLQNQNPLNPMDGMEFVTQLAQFSQLEQLTLIHQQVGTLVQRLSPGQDSVANSDATPKSGT